jgi:hypothetical protein
MGRSAHRNTAPHAAGCGAVRPRRLGALALALGGVTLVGAGALSTWDVTAGASSGDLTAASAGVTLLDANGGRFTTGVADLLPGDWFHRYVDVRNDGSTPAVFTGAVSASGDLAAQLTVDVTSCSLPWTTVLDVSTCAGSEVTLASGPLSAGATVTVPHGEIRTGALAAQHVRYRFAFSASAPAAVQGKGGSVAVSVSNTLVGGRDRTGG